MILVLLYIISCRLYEVLKNIFKKTRKLSFNFRILSGIFVDAKLIKIISISTNKQQYKIHNGRDIDF